MIDRKHSKKDTRVFSLAKDFLLNEVESVTEGMINEHIYFKDKDRPKSLSRLYRSLLESAQNANMMPGVIKGTIGEVYALSKVLFNFSPRLTYAKYTENYQALLSDINVKLKPKKRIRKGKKSIWVRYANAILSGAKFMSQFKNEKDFYEWVDFFYKDDRAREALPLLLASKIRGMGFALSCDFLKEIGYTKFGKPDVHIKKIFIRLGLSQTEDDAVVLKAIERIAKNAGKKPYTVDKLFWLIGSGNFYRNRDKKKFGRNADKFIRYANKRMRG